MDYNCYLCSTEVKAPSYWPIRLEDQRVVGACEKCHTKAFNATIKAYETANLLTDEEKDYNDLCEQAAINVDKCWNEALQDPDFDGWDLIAAEHMKSAYEYRMDMIYAEITKLSKEKEQ